MSALTHDLREAASITAKRRKSKPRYRVISMVDNREFTPWERELDRLMRVRPEPAGKGGYR